MVSLYLTKVILFLLYTNYTLPIGSCGVCDAFTFSS